MADNGGQESSVDDRRREILARLAREGKVRVMDLSRLFGISEVTVRNDLTELEAEGMLKRVHGGAVSTQKAYFNMTLGDRMKVNEAEKRAIAAAAARIVRDGATLIVSSGTTPLYALRELGNVRNLTVITNSVPVAHEAGFCANMQVILLGGTFDSHSQITYGDDTVNQLRRYKADLLLLSADGFSAEDGITTHLLFDAEVNRQMISRANRTIALADHSKIGRTGFVSIGEIELVDCLVTNRAAGGEAIAAIGDRGVEVVLV